MKDIIEMALELMELEEAQTHYPSRTLVTAITVLREALAEQPAQRTWVGLTNEERTQAEEGCWYMDEFDNTIYAMNIEAKLKEKNEM